MTERETRQAEAESEPHVTEHRGKAIARPRRASSHGQLAQRPPSQHEDVEVVRRSQDDMMQPHHPDRGGAPAVRLDMDLDIDIQLKARIKGDIELSIL